MLRKLILQTKKICRSRRVLVHLFFILANNLVCFFFSQFVRNELLEDSFALSNCDKILKIVIVFLLLFLVTIEGAAYIFWKVIVGPREKEIGKHYSNL